MASAAGGRLSGTAGGGGLILSVKEVCELILFISETASRAFRRRPAAVYMVCTARSSTVPWPSITAT